MIGTRVSLVDNDKSESDCESNQGSLHEINIARLRLLAPCCKSISANRITPGSEGLGRAAAVGHEPSATWEEAVDEGFGLSSQHLELLDPNPHLWKEWDFGGGASRQIADQQRYFRENAQTEVLASPCIRANNSCSTNADRGVCLAKEEPPGRESVVADALTDTWFRLELDNGHEISADASGPMKKLHIRTMVGDCVFVEATLYDLDNRRVVYRHRGEQTNKPAQRWPLSIFGRAR